jgi:hypothetical protein
LQKIKTLSQNYNTERSLKEKKMGKCHSTNRYFQMGIWKIHNHNSVVSLRQIPRFVNFLIQPAKHYKSIATTQTRKNFQFSKCDAYKDAADISYSVSRNPLNSEWKKFPRCCWWCGCCVFRQFINNRKFPKAIMRVAY